MPKRYYKVNLHVGIKRNAKKWIKLLFELFYEKSDHEEDTKAIKETIGWLFNDEDGKYYNKPDHVLLDYMHDTMELPKKPKKEMFKALADGEQWFRYVVGFIRIQRAIHTRNFGEQLSDDGCKKSIRNFTVLPIGCAGEKCLKIDTTALMNIHNLAHPHDIVKRPCHLKAADDLNARMSEEYKEMLWSKCFKLEKLKTGTSTFRYFAALDSACIIRNSFAAQCQNPAKIMLKQINWFCQYCRRK